MRTVIAVAAVARNHVIGRDGALVWRDTTDLARLRAMTIGHTVLMGRRTYDSIGRPLPGRHTVVLTRQPDWGAQGVDVVHDVAHSLAAAGDGSLFVLGGGQVYRELLGHTDALELTEIDQDLAGDVTFPTVDPGSFVEIERHSRDGYAWVSYRRIDRREAVDADQLTAAVAGPG